MHEKVWHTQWTTKPKAILVVIIISLLAIGAPIFFAVHEAHLQGLDAVKARALSYARDVGQRTDKTADQITAAIKLLTDAQLDNPCSETAIELMSGVDLGSSYIQAFGHVEGTRMVCSSLGLERAIELGPVQITTSTNTRLRLNVQLDFVPDKQFVVVERDGYAAIIHKDLPLDTSTGDSDISLAIFSNFSSEPLSQRGFIDSKWISKLAGLQEVAFEDGKHVVAIVHSPKYLTFSLASIPSTYVYEQTKLVARLLLPVGILSGLIMTLAIFYVARLQLAIPTVIRQALRRKEFFLLYQPIVDLRTGQYVGAEALIRWRRPVGEIISPDFFIPIAEKSGLITRITQYVLETIAEDAEGLFEKYPGFHIAINLSYEDMHSKETPRLLQIMKDKLNAGPNNIVVEATERGLMNAEVTQEIIKDIHACGITIAIDDFGTGYSSLSYLQTFELDLLKIDKSFVDTIGTEALTGQVLHHIIEIAKDMNFEMIAEGVETQEQADFLRNRGVQYAQGWLYDKPMPYADLIRKLVSQKAGNN